MAFGDQLIKSMISSFFSEEKCRQARQIDFDITESNRIRHEREGEENAQNRKRERMKTKNP